MPRELSKQRPRQGAHLAALRQSAGLTQTELAKLVGDTQRNIAYWEQSEKPPRSDVVPKLARVLGVSLEDLLTPTDARTPERPRGPVGKVRKTFEDVSRLPRRQQDKIIEIVEALMAQHTRKAG
jgi:transcriptional regulator with XRE-family HTH domain